MIYEEKSSLICVEKNKKQEYENWGNGKVVYHSIKSITLLNKKANRNKLLLSFHLNGQMPKVHM